MYYIVTDKLQQDVRDEINIFNNIVARRMNTCQLKLKTCDINANNKRSYSIDQSPICWDFFKLFLQKLKHAADPAAINVKMIDYML